MLLSYDGMKGECIMKKKDCGKFKEVIFVQAGRSMPLAALRRSGQA